ncbi:hypothetical protein GE061_006130 [Apolygus lucorum]|uniref:Peptidase S1 domain-containing protein n=1 Tax=Apolygus lucorum TaxID=248454 RepID=A0A8S9WSW2_APOLU|nr:hypothetical protein GE061_006130 [Apolygus lucorum]
MIKFAYLWVVLVVICVDYCISDRTKRFYVAERGGKLATNKSVDDMENLLHPAEFAWLVMIFKFYNTGEFEPLCVGTLLTVNDVVTTCTCVENQLDDDETSYLMVKPKTSVVDWDDDYKMVHQVLVHDHCQKCSSTTYNDLALLTIEAMILMDGLVEALPDEVLADDSDLTFKQMYSDCFILGLSTGLDTPYFGSLEFLKHTFHAWDISPAPNDLGTVPIFGTTRRQNQSMFQKTRFPGSPLMCLRSAGYVVIGIYLGPFCASKNFDPLDFIKQNCSKPVANCDDCLPKSDLSNCPKPVANCDDCLPKSDLSDCKNNYKEFEIALRIDVLYERVNESIWQPIS